MIRKTKSQSTKLLLLSLIFVALLLFACRSDSTTAETAGLIESEPSWSEEATIDTDQDEIDEEIAQLNQSVSGYAILISWIEGEAVYGTYVFQEIHHCNSGNYVLYGQSRKQTVLDNEQIQRWQEQGAWQITRQQGQLGVYYQPRSGEAYFIPLTIWSNGNISVAVDGVEITWQNQAQCE